MTLILVILIEFLIIILLLFVIKGYGKERDRMKLENSALFEHARFKVSVVTSSLLKKADSIRLNLPNEMYTGSFKKNTIVKETSDRFYELLTKHTN